MEFRYSLTRVCLRTGRFNLPFKMLELFPSEGTVRAYDTVTGADFSLTVEAERQVSGFEGFLQTHSLNVNDSVVISLLEDGRYALTPQPRSQPQLPQIENFDHQALADQLAERGTPLSEPEIRRWFKLSPEADVAEVLRADERFLLHEGRWTLKARLPEDVRSDVPQHRSKENSQLEEESSSTQVIGFSKAARVTPYPKGVLFPSDTGLNSAQDPLDLSDHNRARRFLNDFGFQLDSLAHGQFLARADLNRRQFSVLIHLVSEQERVDWSKLLNRRRDLQATYLAVFGDHRDLAKLQSPADLAQATLWPWNALERIRNLSQTVAINLIDLESHFQRDGLFDHGLQRFEKIIGQRIAERGDFSAVLSQLAAFKAPAIFLLDDVISDLELPRDQVLKQLEYLSQAPFHMINRVDDGEFCLRYNVSDALLRLSEYALSLRQHFPKANVEHLSVAVELDDTYSFDGLSRGVNKVLEEN